MESVAYLYTVYLKGIIGFLPSLLTILPMLKNLIFLFSKGRSHHLRKGIFSVVVLATASRSPKAWGICLAKLACLPRGSPQGSLPMQKSASVDILRFFIILVLQCNNAYVRMFWPLIGNRIVLSPIFVAIIFNNYNYPIFLILVN